MHGCCSALTRACRGPYPRRICRRRNSRCTSRLIENPPWACHGSNATRRGEDAYTIRAIPGATMLRAACDLQARLAQTYRPSFLPVPTHATRTSHIRRTLLARGQDGRAVRVRVQAGGGGGVCKEVSVLKRGRTRRSRPGLRARAGGFARRRRPLGTASTWQTCWRWETPTRCTVPASTSHSLLRQERDLHVVL